MGVVVGDDPRRAGVVEPHALIEVAGLETVEKAVGHVPCEFYTQVVDHFCLDVHGFLDVDIVGG